MLIHNNSASNIIVKRNKSQLLNNKKGNQYIPKYNYLNFLKSTLDVQAKNKNFKKFQNSFNLLDKKTKSKSSAELRINKTKIFLKNELDQLDL